MPSEQSSVLEPRTDERRLAESSAVRTTTSEGGPVPRRSTYQEMSLADALRGIALHHSEPRTRHISVDEREVLLRAADAIEADRPTAPAYP